MASRRWGNKFSCPAALLPPLLWRPGNSQTACTSWMPLCSGWLLGTGLEEASALKTGTCDITQGLVFRNYTQNVGVFFPPQEVWAAQEINAHQILFNFEKVWFKIACLLLISLWDWLFWIVEKCNPLGNEEKYICISQSLLTLIHSGFHVWIN